MVVIPGCSLVHLNIIILTQTFCSKFQQLTGFINPHAILTLYAQNDVFNVSFYANLCRIDRWRRGYMTDQLSFNFNYYTGWFTQK